jgi:hypothetical protein
MEIIQLPACWLSSDDLAKAFWNSFEDEETFTGGPDTLRFAQEIVDRGSDMWNWPSAVEDAEAYLTDNA